MIVITIVQSVILILLSSYIVTFFLQLHRYEICSMLKTNFYELSILLSFVFSVNLLSVVLSICFYNSKILLLIIMCLIIMIETIISIIIFKKYIHKNKLKFTKRVIRQLFITYLFYIILTYINYCYLYKYNLFICNILLSIIIGIYASKILEIIIYKTYIKKAKLKLNNYSHLTKIAITGSYGKTSTKHILQQLLSTKYISCCTPASVNTPMGICKFILNTNFDNVDYLIIEMGAVRVGDIKELCDFICPDIGIITSIGCQHLDSFKNIDNIIKTKTELGDYIINNNGLLICNYGNKYLKNNYNYNRNIYGVAVNNLINIDNNININDKYYSKNIDKIEINKIDKNGVNFKYCEIHSKKVEYLSTILLGESSVINISLAIKCALLLGMNFDDISYAVSNLTFYNNRMELRTAKSGASVIYDAYNSNIESFKEMLSTISKFDAKNKILITPGLVELGQKQYEANYEIAKMSLLYFNEIWVINKVNRKSFIDAYANIENMSVKIVYYDSLDTSIFNIVDKFDSDNLIVFENDLPDIYR